VQDGFARLGYPSLEEACEAADGFSVARPPTAWERPLIALLEQTATQVFPDLLGEKPLPPCLIIKHDRAVWMGMAVCIPRNNQARNIAGWVMRHELAYVALKPGLLRIGRGSEALSTYLHELAHSFGGDRSAAFGHALTWLLETALNHAVELTQFQQAWDRYCAVEQRLKPAPSSKDLIGIGNPTARGAGAGACTRWEALDKRRVRAGREGRGSRRPLGGDQRWAVRAWTETGDRP